MKNTKTTPISIQPIMRNLLLILLVLIPVAVMAQSTEFDAAVKLGGRYVPDAGIELRLFPERKQLLDAGLRDGFILERRLSTATDFTEIARIFPLEADAWEATILEEADANPERASNLDLAYAFYQSVLDPRGGEFNLDGGISGLRIQRGNEDFEFAVFILTAVRDSAVANALALGYTDTDVQRGQRYVYRVRPAGEVAIYNVVWQEFEITADADPDRYQNPVYVYEDEQRLLFQWEETEHVAGYYIERRGPGEDRFTQLNEAPLFNLSNATEDGLTRGSYIDEDLQNYQVYAYRFSGYTMFGERVVFDELEAMPRDRTPPGQPSIQTPQHVSPREVLVEWEMTEPVASDLMGFAVARSSQNEGGFEILHREILPADQRSFIDTTFVEGQTNYYLVQAVDTAYNVSSSFPVSVMLIDTIPPAAPVFRRVVTGRESVTLYIAQSESRDVAAQKIYRTTDLREPWQILDTLQVGQQVYTDSLVEQGQLYYYTMRAVDFSDNWSDYAFVVQARPYDNGIRDPIENIRFSLDNDDIVLNWEYPLSGEEVYFVVYRSDAQGRLRQYRRVTETTFREALGSAGSDGTSISYAVKAFTSDGGESLLSEAVIVQP